MVETGGIGRMNEKLVGIGTRKSGSHYFFCSIKRNQIATVISTFGIQLRSYFQVIDTIFMLEMVKLQLVYGKTSFELASW